MWERKIFCYNLMGMNMFQIFQCRMKCYQELYLAYIKFYWDSISSYLLGINDMKQVAWYISRKTLKEFNDCSLLNSGFCIKRWQHLMPWVPRPLIKSLYKIHKVEKPMVTNFLMIFATVGTTQRTASWCLCLWRHSLVAHLNSKNVFNAKFAVKRLEYRTMSEDLHVSTQ